MFSTRVRASVSEMIPAFFPDAERGEAKAGRRDAGHHRVVGGCLARIASVFDQAGLRVGLLPEIANRESFQFFQKLVIVRRKNGFDRRRRRTRVLLRSG